jgi:hypothetical protein
MSGANAPQEKQGMNLSLMAAILNLLYRTKLKISG